MWRLLPILLASVAFAVAGGSDAPSTQAATGSAFVHCEHNPQPDDLDCDAVKNSVDNCPEVPNSDQLNVDGDSNGDRIQDDPYSASDPEAADGSSQAMPVGDGAGDECDDDDDADGVADSTSAGARLDNCRSVRNPSQLDSNGNGYGENTAGEDLCGDSDGDGHVDDLDNCRGVANPDQADLDDDNLGDACDGDDDGDGVADAGDNCPRVENGEQADRDGDGIGTACDGDEVATQPLPAVTEDGSPPRSRDTTRPSLRVTLARRQRVASVLGGMPTAVSCSEACGLSAKLTLSARAARRARLPRRLGVASGLLGARGRTFLILKLERRATRRLRRLARRAPATLVVSAVDPAGNRRRASRRILLTR